MLRLETIEEFCPNVNALNNLDVRIDAEGILEMEAMDEDVFEERVRSLVAKVVAETDDNPYHNYEHHVSRMVEDVRELIEVFVAEILKGTELVKHTVAVTQALVLAGIAHDWIHDGKMGADHPDFQTNVLPTMYRMNAQMQEWGINEGQRLLVLEGIMQTHFTPPDQLPEEIVEVGGIQATRLGMLLRLSDLNVRNGTEAFVRDGINIYREHKSGTAPEDLFSLEGFYHTDVEAKFIPALEKILEKAGDMGFRDTWIHWLKRLSPWAKKQKKRAQELALWQQNFEQKKNLIKALIAYEKGKSAKKNMGFPVIPGLGQKEYDELTADLRPQST